ncbi:Arylamine N-acetyltransferase [Phlyctema vagabunda]|uniref:Arylamine N-acetyltransferase n=1 Tax=Phlyctema vagabunda TaxID=108571 RepID=A0ABR4P837_9HELO
MENSLFFNHVLRALGFRVYTAGVRIRMRENGVPKGDYIGFVHIVNIVTLPDGTKYMIDVGFGGDQATRPLALSVDKPQKNLGSQEIRLIRGTISTQTDPSQQLWIYQYRNQREHEWNSFYAFGEFEFLPADWHMLNYFVSTNIGPTNIQVARLLVVRFLREGSEIVGKLMCVDKEVKRNMGGKTTIECEFANEQERVEGLKRIFGITLTDEEVEGIKGSIVELIAVK